MNLRIQLVLSCLASVVGVGPVLAQTPGPYADLSVVSVPEVSGRALQAGAAAFKGGRYDEAITQGEAAFAAGGAADALELIAISALRVGRVVLATEVYACLAEAADTPAPVRKRAQNQLSALSRQGGSLTLVVEPPGARVTFDGQSVGRSPLPRPLIAFPGSHVVIVTANGHERAERRLALAAGERSSLSITLVAEAGLSAPPVHEARVEAVTPAETAPVSPPPPAPSTPSAPTPVAAAVPASHPAAESHPAPASSPNSDTPAAVEPPSRAASHEAPSMSAGATLAPYDRTAFGPDPRADVPYDPAAQLFIYGGKHAVDSTRPLIELGRPLYGDGPIEPGLPMHLMVYGDLRLAGGAQDQPAGGEDAGSSTRGQTALQLNLDIDWKLTSTARVHAFLQPLQSDGKVTRVVFSGLKDKEETAEFQHIFKRCIDASCDARQAIDDIGALYYEGDLTGDHGGTLDLPFVLGKFPLLLQNGVWADDAVTGVAFTVPAGNSRALDISNYDLTFFGLFDGVNQPGLAPLPAGALDVFVYGFNFFIESSEKYYEFGYGFTHNQSGLYQSGAPQAKSYHSAALSVTQRFGTWLSNSVRVVGNFGQTGGSDVKASGVAVLVENAFITRRPSTLVPYLNLFAGFDRPQPLARQFGLLRNSGLAFEGDALTGQKGLTDAAADTAGASLGLEYLFGLDRQIVVEVTGAVGLCDAAARERNLLGETCARDEKGTDQFALALRFQQPLGGPFLIRFDALGGQLRPRGRAGPTNLAGARAEIRLKF